MLYGLCRSAGAAGQATRPSSCHSAGRRDIRPPGRFLDEQREDGWNCRAAGHSRRSSFNTTISVLEGCGEHEQAWAGRGGDRKRVRGARRTCRSIACSAGARTVTRRAAGSRWTSILGLRSWTAGGWGILVGAAGFEPTTSCAQGQKRRIPKSDEFCCAVKRAVASSYGMASEPC